MTKRIQLLLLSAAWLATALGCSEEGPPESGSIASLDIRFDTVAVLGAMDGEPWEVFGLIAAAEISESGRLAVLDLQANAVFVFDAESHFVGAVDRRGQGPGEMRQVRAIAWDAEDHLFVMDVGNARISKYQAMDDGLSFVASQPTNLRAGSLCLVDGRIFVGDAHDGRVIHEIGPDGSLIRSFGVHPNLGDVSHLAGFEPLAILQTMSGKLLCSADDGGRLLHVSTSHPGMRLHDGSGAEIWSSEIAGVYPFEMVIEGSAFTARYGEATGAHFARSVLRWDSDHVLVQHEVRYPMPPPDDRDFHALDSRLISLQTGLEVARSAGLPLLVASRGDRYVHVRHAPYPQVIILKRR